MGRMDLSERELSNIEEVTAKGMRNQEEEMYL